VTARSIAVVSGKGGSGKTMIATAMGFQFGTADHDLKIVLMDADIGTAGMSYFLGLNEVRNIWSGFSAIALHPEKHADNIAKLLQPVRSYRHYADSAGSLRFLPVGDHRKINREYQRNEPDSADRKPLAPVLTEVIGRLGAEADLLIIDCRGGIDDESLAVCRAVDDIILVVEPDITSFQTSSHLVQVLNEVGLVDKLQGFIVNKAYSNFEPLISNGTATFGAQFLGGIPYDISACRSFLVGKLPSSSSIFATHVANALNRAYPDEGLAPRRRVWRARDYNSASVFARSSSRYRIAIAFMLLAIGIAFTLNVLNRAVPPSEVIVVTLALSVIGAISSALLPFETSAGRAPGKFTGLLRRIMFLRD
jgi:septum site-determining protein MinD